MGLEVVDAGEHDGLEPSGQPSGKFGFAFRFTSKLQKRSAFGADEEHPAESREDAGMEEGWAMTYR